MRNLAAIVDLPFAPTLIGDTLGKRETHNSSRLFFAADEQARFPVCRDVADAFQNQGNVAYLEALCGIDLAGSYLRIEYCRDTDGFWLAPHTDIGTKLLTILIYVSNEPGCMAWGTDLLTPDGKIALTVPYVPNTGLMFVPGRDSWHGFHKRPINGVRRTLIVNYVRVEWRARRELAFPDNAIGRPLSSARLTAFV